MSSHTQENIHTQEWSLYMPETIIKQIMKEKLGELISLDIDKIQISEFNTRCQFVDENHVKTLMRSIEENGYIPKSAAWVNAIKGPDREIITYRLVAGRHRYEASRRLGLDKIPCQLYYNLTDEEECTLDEIDNKLDEHHKPADFLSIAEHYKYLRDIKLWSLRKIASAKNISKSLVHYRIQIADLSDEIKDIIKTVHPGGQLHEKHFRYICKLSLIPHQILICREIIGSRTERPDGHKNDRELIFINPKPMTQKDIEARVEELLELEKQGKTAPEAQHFTGEISLTSTGKSDIVINEAIDETEFRIEERQPMEQLEFDIFSELSEYREYEGLKFSILPLWIRHTDLIKNMCNSSYLLLNELITYDFRYKPEKDKYFFIKHSSKYNKCEDFLSHMAGVKPKTLDKKILPDLKKYVNYRKTEKTIKFQLKWDKLYEVYAKYAKEIPFDDGGLLNIPPDFKGWLRPTPYHGIYIEDGQIKKYKNIGQETNLQKKQKKKQEVTLISPTKAPSAMVTHDDISPLAIRLKELGMAEQQIVFCLQKKETTEDVLKYIDEMSLYEKNKIQKLPGFIYKLVKDEFRPPEGFESAKVAESKKEKKKVLEEFVTIINAKFRNKEITHFSPREGVKYPISVIPNNFTFLYKKNDGVPIAGIFAEWADEKFFC